MKFVHIADMHFDAPFTTINGKTNFGDKKRLEQRKTLKRIIEYIKEKNIEFLFIAGDLYENDYVKYTTIEYINSLFKEIPNTKIIITPGNHDPVIKNSYYNTFNWNSNVYILKNNLEKLEFDECNIYGSGFTDFYKDEENFDNLKLEHSKINILVIHADINGVKDSNGFSYNPISNKKLENFKFNYVALGHIHNSNFEPNKSINYPGSTIALGFDELESHGMIVGEIDKFNQLHTEYIELGESKFVEQEINVENIFSKEELIENINNLQLDEKNLYKIMLVGKRNFSINAIEIEKIIQKENIIKIKDESKSNFNIEDLEKENSLKGLFIKNLKDKLKEKQINEEEFNRILEIGLEVL